MLQGFFAALPTWVLVMVLLLAVVGLFTTVGIVFALWLPIPQRRRIGSSPAVPSTSRPILHVTPGRPSPRA